MRLLLPAILGTTMALGLWVGARSYISGRGEARAEATRLTPQQMLLYVVLTAAAVGFGLAFEPLRLPLILALFLVISANMAKGRRR